MSKRAEEKALEVYPVEMNPLNYQDLIDQFGGKTEIDINTYPRRLFQEGYEEAEQDTIERAIAWLKEHASNYIVNCTESYPDAPANIVVGGMCWEHLRKAMEEENQE